MSDYPERLIDKRIVERNITKGLVDRAAYEAQLESLPDVSGNAEVVDLDAAPPEVPEEEAPPAPAAPTMPEPEPGAGSPPPLY